MPLETIETGALPEVRPGVRIPAVGGRNDLL